ncbi:hypothetical protein ACHAXM_000256 [Skeletonema potamos]|jgi:hypothetical protein
MTSNNNNSASADVALTPDAITQLRNKTFAVVDDFLPLDLANQLLSDAENLNSNGEFKQHYFQFGGSALAKPSIYELDLSAPDDGSMDDTMNKNLGSWKHVIDYIGPAFVKKVDELDKQFDDDTSTATAPPIALDVNARPAIKVQLNTGGGSFPWHYDNPGPPNLRVLTCVVYLNPKWKEGDGGEIVLWPFLSNPTTIPPLHRRAVLFYSDRVLHRVLPSRNRRVCFTIWSQGMNVNCKRDVALSKDVLQFTSYDQAVHFFAQSPLQRVISRAVYSEEYVESLLECIAGTREENDEGITTSAEKDKVVQQHNASVMSIMSKLRPLIDEFRRRKEC